MRALLRWIGCSGWRMLDVASAVLLLGAALLLRSWLGPGAMRWLLLAGIGSLIAAASNSSERIARRYLKLLRTTIVWATLGGTLR